MDSPAWIAMLKFYDINVEDFAKMLRETKHYTFGGKPFFNIWISKISEKGENLKLPNLVVIL